MPNLFDDKYMLCPARGSEFDGMFITCGIRNEYSSYDDTCHEANCPVYFWIEMFAERMPNGRSD